MERQTRTPSLPGEIKALQTLVEVLQRQLDDARTREQATLERAERLEQATLEREGRLLALLERLQPQHQQSHEANQSPHPAQGQPQSQRYMYEHILKVLQGYPEGLQRQEIERLVGTSKNLSDTLVNMVRRKQLTRVAKGTYALAQPSPLPS